ncbi:MAG: hypothetical protein IIB94_04130 [Candidatus Marinimicrobia bacterium]|nr:hypothetical protein [Candidatus Neomarinimicrobiota bacterium]
MNNKEERISELILNYLRKNPDAGDTVEGISNWWLEIERIDYTIDSVKDALKVLLKNGTVKEHKSREGTIIYKVNEKQI